MRPRGIAAALERRRRRAQRLLAKGKGIRAVAIQVKASPSSVKRWKDAIQSGGRNALKAKPHPGRTPALSKGQRKRLLALLVKGPKAAGFQGIGWTCVQVKALIRRRFGVRYHRTHVGRILRALGWTNLGRRGDRRIKRRG